MRYRGMGIEKGCLFEFIGDKFTQLHYQTSVVLNLRMSGRLRLVFEQQEELIKGLTGHWLRGGLGAFRSYYFTEERILTKENRTAHRELFSKIYTLSETRTTPSISAPRLGPRIDFDLRKHTTIV